MLDALWTLAANSPAPSEVQDIIHTGGWWESSVVVAVVSSICTGILSLIAAWVQFKRMGLDNTSVAEITDRATFRTHLLGRLQAVEDRLLRAEQAEEECLRREGALKARVFELELHARRRKPAPRRK